MTDDATIRPACNPLRRWLQSDPFVRRQVQLALTLRPTGSHRDDPDFGLIAVPSGDIAELKLRKVID